MSPVQETYTERMRPAVKGMIHGSDYTTVTRYCEDAAGCAFGLGVSQGTADKGAVKGGASEDFIGITVRDIALGAEVDVYPETKNMGVLTRGQIWVVAPAAIAAGDPVYMVPGTGVITNSSGGNELIQGAAFRSSGAENDLVLVELAGFKPAAT